MDSLSYIGHATTLLRLDGVSILTDPMLRGGLGPLRRQGPPPDPEVPQIADLVLISHLHRDHLDLPSLRHVPPETPVVAPRDSSGEPLHAPELTVVKINSRRPFLEEPAQSFRK